ncbi:MAG: GC-type dockerin domain-anchored protein [Phycisphaerales bacterium JB060]
MSRYAMTLAVLLLASLSAADDGCEPHRYTSPPGTSATHFGDSIASTGRFWFIGDTQARTPCPGGLCLTGAVHVYEMVDGRLEFFQTLTPGLGMPTNFGAWIHSDGERIVTNSWYGQFPGAVGFGGGFVFEFDGARWISAGLLVPPPDFVFDEAGAGVAIDDDLAIMSPSLSLEQWVYKRGPSGWEIVQRLRSPDDLPRSAGFGTLYKMQGEWIFTNASADSSTASEGGSMYVFLRTADDEIEFVQKIEPPVPEAELRFGFDHDVDGRTLAITAYGANREVERQGAIFIYELEGDRWVFEQEINHQNPVENDRFGARLDLHGDTLIAYVNSGNPATPQDNRVLVFRRGPDGLWRETGELVPNPPHRTQFYGASMMAIEGNHALVGAIDDWITPDARDLGGAAYLFDLTCIGCRPDLDLDGSLTIFDFLTFQNLFQDGDLQADFDGDGELTLFDFLAVQTAFDAGCE